MAESGRSAPRLGPGEAVEPWTISWRFGTWQRSNADLSRFGQACESDSRMGTREGEAVRYIFDEFVLSPSEQRLRRGGQVVRLGGRPIEILTALVERAGQIVSKEDLTKRAWPRKTVDASNLTVNSAAIRRALEGSRPEKRFIATVSGQGYRFVEPPSTSRPSPP